MNQNRNKLLCIQLTRALKCLDAFQVNAKTEIAKFGTAKAFQFTFELIWQLMQKDLATIKICTSNPYEVIIHGQKENLIDDIHIWLSLLDIRNSLVNPIDTETLKSNHFDEIIHDIAVHAEKLSLASKKYMQKRAILKQK